MSVHHRLYLLIPHAYLIFLGHRWISVTVKFECMQIAASGVFEEKGCIWILDKKNKLITLDNSFNTLKVGFNLNSLIYNLINRVCYFN